MHSWGSLLTQLHDLTAHEKSYHNLEFFEQKWFGRKESLKSAYDSVANELRHLQKVFSQRRSGMSSQWETQMSQLCQQLLTFVSVRQQMMQYYCELAAMATSLVLIDYNKELSKIGTLKQQCGSLHFLEPMESMSKMIKDELQCLELVNESQIRIASCQFLEALLSLDACKSLLMSWNGPSPQIKKPRFLLISKYTGETQLHHWLRQFYSLLLAKFSLYNHKVLVAQSPSADVKLPVELDFYARLFQFQKVTNAVNVAVVFDANGSTEVYQGYGYHLPDAKAERPFGLSSYPAIVSIPSDIVLEHWPSIVCLVTERSQHLDQNPNPLQFLDEKTQNLYIVTKIEEKMYLVLIYKSRRQSRDLAIASFLSEMISILRNTRQYNLLHQKKTKQ
ncbi:KICSTOR subunit 2-like isoform X2 [Corticium candelabrum]|nr:KICSTOR subunit 2-like isoform X2 [Corticium candelabrum]